MQKTKDTVSQDNEIIGYKFRIYPSPDQVEALRKKQADLKLVWNWLVKTLQTEPQAALKAAAIERGLVPPSKPDYKGLTPKEAKQRKHDHKKAWVEFYQQAQVLCPELKRFRKLKDVLEEKGYKHDYQIFANMPWIGGDKPSCGELQAVCYSYRQYSEGQKQKRTKRGVDTMPLRLRTGGCFLLGEYETREKKKTSPRRWNCAVKFARMLIPGRSHREELRGVPMELLVQKLYEAKATGSRMLEGVAIREEADGWYASVKCEVPKRELPKPIPGKRIGLDVGLVYIVAGSDGLQVKNNRLEELTERIAGRQSKDLPVGKMHQKAARIARNIIHTQVVKHVQDCEVVVIEDSQQLPNWPNTKVSAMGAARSILKQKLGDRVREVSPEFTSQECSQCGHRSKSAWGYKPGRIGKCPACGFKCDRDINAARNILRKYEDSQGEKPG